MSHFLLREEKLKHFFSLLISLYKLFIMVGHHEILSWYTESVGPINPPQEGTEVVAL